MVQRAYPSGPMVLLISLALSLPQIGFHAGGDGGKVSVVVPAADSEPGTPTATATPGQFSYGVPGLESSASRTCALQLTNEGPATASVSVDFLNTSGVLVTSAGLVIPQGSTSVMYIATYVGNSFTGSAEITSDQPLGTSVTCSSTTPTPSVSPVPTSTLTTASRYYVPLVRQLQWFSGPMEHEPNNTFAQANGPLVSGTDYRGYPNDEKDYFAILVNHSGQIHVQLIGHTGEEVQVQLMFGSVKNVVGSATSPPFEIRYDGVPGTYYIYIHSAGGYGTSTTYALSVSFP